VLKIKLNDIPTGRPAMKKRKVVQSRSVSIRLSMRTFNEIDQVLSRQEAEGNRKDRQRAALLRRRLERALPAERQ
jgi:hypothetical protein